MACLVWCLTIAENADFPELSAGVHQCFMAIPLHPHCLSCWNASNKQLDTCHTSHYIYNSPNKYRLFPDRLHCIMFFHRGRPIAQNCKPAGHELNLFRLHWFQHDIHRQKPTLFHVSHSLYNDNPSTYHYIQLHSHYIPIIISGEHPIDFYFYTLPILDTQQLIKFLDALRKNSWLANIPMYCSRFWSVVSTPLKNMNVSWRDSSQYMGKS